MCGSKSKAVVVPMEKQFLVQATQSGNANYSLHTHCKNAMFINGTNYRLDTDHTMRYSKRTQGTKRRCFDCHITQVMTSGDFAMPKLGRLSMIETRRRSSIIVSLKSSSTILTAQINGYSATCRSPSILAMFKTFSSAQL